MAETTFHQKRLAHRTQFGFAERAVRVRIEDNQGAVEFDQPYDEIPFESRTITEKMMALRGAAIFFAVVAAYNFGSFALSGGADGGLISGAIHVVLAAAAEWGYRRANVSFTVIEATQGVVHIINDQQKDQILAMIGDRRRAVLRVAASEINIENPVDIEVEKFNWLHEHDVITDDEHREKLQALGKLSELGEMPSPKRLH
ncbi:MAG: hypothetical protein HRU11_11135 [Parvularculaceae bacterium]|nr:hypothetical protein [Parvularculaceae bacterium]